MPSVVEPSEASAAPRVALSPLTELEFSFYVISQAATSPGKYKQPWVHAFLHEHAGLLPRAADFWGPGERLGCGELVVLAWRAGVILSPDVPAALAGIERAAGEPFAVPPMPSETAETVQQLHLRLRRLHSSADLRAQFFALVRDIWAAIEPFWNSEGRATAEAMRRTIESQLAAGTPLREAVSQNHYFREAEDSGLVAEAARRGEIVIVPLGLAGTGSTFWALPGILLVGFGPDRDRRSGRGREEAEETARVFKLVSDPTRCAILTRLTEHALGISELAGYFGVSQPTVSVHVKMLREAGLVEPHKAGGQTYYTAAPAHVRSVLEAALTRLVGPVV